MKVSLFCAAVGVYIAVLINLVFHLAHLYGFTIMGVAIAAFVYVSLQLSAWLFRKPVKNIIRMLSE
jgi:hypothetical protein